MKEKLSLKPIPLSLRENKRYIVFELISKERFNFRNVRSELNRILFDLFGEKGVSELSFNFILFNEKNSKGIIRCRHTETEKAKTAILFLKEINSIKAIPKIVRASGSIKKAKSFVQ
ncbi:hypothetical protein KJ660_01920 [Candidatus Micrarchaeota archaeon]|nr:hypothetical protein [Candidatus Micrarchaeota archaeon]